MHPKNLDKLITEALAIEAQEAKEAGALGYMARVLTQATMPHKAVKGAEFVRYNGSFSLTIVAPSVIGIPYGTIPRLVLSWLTTEAVRTKSPELILGHTLSGFMRDLGLIPSGGAWGTITRLRAQMQRLFSASINCTYGASPSGGATRSAGLNINIASAYDLWWHPQHPEQAGLWQSTVTLSKDFFEEVINRPVPIDMRALTALKRSPLALDIYCWLTYRMSYLAKPTLIPWEALQTQFGADYKRTIDFKIKFLNQLRAVLVVYPRCKVTEDKGGLLLKPSLSHIKRLSTKPNLIIP